MCKNWLKLIEMDQNRSPLACYKMLKDLDDQGRRTWATDIRNMLYRYGFGYVWMNQGVGDTTAFINAFYQRVRDCAMQEWNSSRANSSKLKFYNQVKTELGFELYLTHINVKKLRAAMSRFRCSNHILKIETGRYDGTNEENRYCPLCTKKGLFLIENEFHLIVECEYYATLRNAYLKSEYLNYIRFIELFTSTDKSILFNLATFLYKSLLLRSNL